MARYIDTKQGKNDARDMEMPLKADVAPVIHAHWIETEDLSGNHYAECSNCCLLWWIDGESSQEAEMNYCPKCGAKMDGEIRNDR